jgi:hypothetical protein
MRTLNEIRMRWVGVMFALLLSALLGGAALSNGQGGMPCDEHGYPTPLATGGGDATGSLPTHTVYGNVERILSAYDSERFDAIDAGDGWVTFAPRLPGSQSAIAAPGGVGEAKLGPYLWHGVPIERTEKKGPGEKDDDFRNRCADIFAHWIELFPPDAVSGWPN